MKYLCIGFMICHKFWGNINPISALKFYSLNCSNTKKQEKNQYGIYWIKLSLKSLYYHCFNKNTDAVYQFGLSKWSPSHDYKRLASLPIVVANLAALYFQSPFSKKQNTVINVAKHLSAATRHRQRQVGDEKPWLRSLHMHSVVFYALLPRQ